MSYEKAVMKEANKMKLVILPPTLVELIRYPVIRVPFDPKDIRPFSPIPIPDPDPGTDDPENPDDPGGPTAGMPIVPPPGPTAGMPVVPEPIDPIPIVP